MSAADFLFTLPQPSLAVIGGGRFPVRRIFCIGRNYPEHAREMGSDPKAEPPFFFQKAADTIQPVAADETGDHPYPPLTRDYQPEVELVVALREGGRDIARDGALYHVFGYAVGLDMTRRDLQQKMKDGRRPWEIGKSFDRAAPIGPLVPVGEAGHIAHGAISLAVNGTIRQRDDLSAMIWNVADQIAILSQSSALAAGDIIFSGTPAGVAPVVPGDELLAKIAGLPSLQLRIVAAV